MNPPPSGERAADVPADVLRVRAGGEARPDTDRVIVEEPLEIRLGERRLLVTMRTPGHDLDLVRGLMFTEGLVARPEDVAAVSHCRDVPDDARGNVVSVSLRAGAVLDDDRAARVALVSSGCGVCGKASLEMIRAEAPPVADGPSLDPALLVRLPDALTSAQPLFAATGGLHAAVLFTSDGRLLSLREDVGRHNAVDKVIGEAARFGRLPLGEVLLLVSGRAGFEIVQKARRAGIPVVCSVSAPSSLAIELARDGNQTLVGFLRGGSFNVYAGAGRLVPASNASTPTP